MAEAFEIVVNEEKSDEIVELKCRRCRTVLTTSAHFDSSHNIEKDCSCVFLDTERLNGWTSEAVRNGGWTSGKLKCPKCSNNIGGINYVNPTPCNCGISEMPSVWLLKTKVDEKQPLSKAHVSFVSERNVLRQRMNIQSAIKKSDEKPAAGVNTGLSYEEKLNVGHCECIPCHLSDANKIFHDEIKEELSLEMFACQCGEECKISNDNVQLCTGESAVCQLRRHVCLHEEMKQIRDELSRLTAERDRLEAPQGETQLYREQRSKDPIVENAASKLEDVEVSGQHLCPVCLDLLYNPFETPCEHVFCAPCLRQLHHASGGCPLCPLCRQPVHFVRTRLELEKELQNVYPLLYKNRHRFESCRPCRLWPLPSPSNTTFSLLDDNRSPHQRRQYHRVMHSPNSNDTNYLWILLADTLSTVKLVVLLFCHLLLLLVFHQDSVTTQNDTSVRRSAQHIALLLFSLTITCVLILAGGALLVYAFDFVKLALVIVLCYAGLVKLVIAVATDRE